MHLPDGFLAAPVSGALYVASGAALGAAVRRAGDESEPGAAAPTMGLTAAFLFVAQMLNFPIAGGTSGHLLGATLATALLGPWRGLLVLTVVVAIQAFGFADGGVVVLGANVFNMAVAGCLLSAVVLSAARRLWLARPVALGVAAWLSVMLAAALTAVELAASGRVAAGVVLPAMLSVHAVIGVGEALLTVAAYNLLVHHRRLPGAGVWTGGQGAEPWRLGVVLVLGLLLLRLACPHPDGLESVARAQGFAVAATEVYRGAPLPDYALPGRSESVGAWVSAVAGIVACGGLMLAVGSGFRRRTAS